MTIDYSGVTRFEVINHTDDVQEWYSSNGTVIGWTDIGVRLVCLQDDGRTLKVFLKNQEVED